MTAAVSVGAVLLAAAFQPGKPSLQGRITDPAGRPVFRATVILYGGIATRWKVDETTTDADGRYRFEAVAGAMTKSREDGFWSQYVGVRVEHPTYVEADGRSWRDLRIIGLARHVETLDLTLTPAGHIDGTLTDQRTGQPLRNLALRLYTPAGPRGHGSSFLVYATTDTGGRFRTLSLFPGEYAIDVNSGTLDYPVVGRVTVAAGKVTTVRFDAVELPRVIGGQVVDADGKPLDGVDVTLLAAKDTGFEPRKADDLMTVRTRAWDIVNTTWRQRFELAFLPGLEDATAVLAVHKEHGWAKVTVASLEKGEPIRLRPWAP